MSNPTQQSNAASQNPWLIFKQSVKNNPNKIAIIDENDRQTTFKTLQMQCEALSAYFTHLGIKKYSHVGLVGEPSRLCLTIALALVRCGAIIVAIDNRYPPLSIQEMLTGNQCTHLITHQLMPEFQQAIIIDDSCLKTQPPIPDEALLNADEIGMVLFTSGTTGKAKGVQVPMHGHLPYASQYQQYGFAMSLFKGSISWIGALPILQITQGDTILVVPHTTMLSPAEFLQRINQYGTKEIGCVPSYLTALMTQPLLLQKLQRIYVYGELIPETLINKMKTQFPNIAFIEQYGLTEALRFIATRILSSPLTDHVTAWKPELGYQLHILDEQDQPVAVGEAGEICIASQKLALDYACEKNPLGAGKLYRTGDRATRLADDSFTLLGRKDSQVKIRGIRVELSGIESYANQDQTVKIAIAKLVETSAGHNIALYLTPENIDLPALKSHLRKLLPSYALPAYYITLPTMPRLPNGKIDRRALPTTDLSGMIFKDNYLAPRNTLEQQIVEIWQQALGVHKIGVFDNFFELGGHSLLIIDVTDAIKQNIGIALTSHEFFIHPTVSEIAPLIEKLKQDNSLSEKNCIQAMSRKLDFPASFLQEVILILQPRTAARKNINLAYQIQGPLDTECLTASFNEVIRRHEILRTTYGTCDGSLYQIINPYKPISQNIIDCTHLKKNPAAKEALELVQHQTVSPFKLGEEWPIKTFLIQLSEIQHLLLITLHSIAADAWSLDILQKELLTIYTARLNKKPIELPKLSIQYADFSYWQREYCTENFQAKQVKFYQQKLADLTNFNLAKNKTTPEDYFETVDYRHILPHALQQQLHAFSQQYQMTLFMVLLAVFEILLYRHSEQEKFLITAPINLRNCGGIKNLLGNFADNMGFRVDFSTTKTFIQLLKAIHTETVLNHQHQGCPFAMLLSMLIATRAVHPELSVQATINVLLREETPLALPGLTVTPEHDIETPAVDVLLRVTSKQEGIQLAYSLNANLFSEQEAQTFSEQFLQLLEAAMTNPQYTIDQLA